MKNCHVTKLTLLALITLTSGTSTYAMHLPWPGSNQQTHPIDPVFGNPMHIYRRPSNPTRQTNDLLDLFDDAFQEEPADLDAFIDQNGANARINGTHVAYHILINDNIVFAERQRLLTILKGMGINFSLSHKDGCHSLHAELTMILKRRRTRGPINPQSLPGLAAFLLS